MLRSTFHQLQRAGSSVSFTAARASYSTTIGRKSVEEPSVNYRPGKEGYAPGMPHARGSSAAPMPPPEPRTAEDLPNMSKKHDYKAHGTPKQQYDYEMTKLRHSFQRDHLKDEAHKRSRQTEQRQKSLKKLQARQEADRIANEKRQAFETLMHPVGYGTGAERKQRVAEFVEARKEQRLANFHKREEQESEERLDNLIRLYHAAEDFVTHENLDRKVNEFYEQSLSMGTQLYTDRVGDMVRNVVDNGGVVSSQDLAKREQDLKDALDGTVLGGKVGYESAKTKMESLGDAPTSA
ncbi:hypothetical protein DFQ27_004843 [Actinomortierella ambigua]|uniref:Uncharacterized protein n=1 Tax=Actinomortierella ambigua TaxID=1343610 RepID=A0A9P6QHL7_9FUNG|nr:hypothetical protein DFQ26_005561 [Actinomortierella ambigua]KAG0269084.1 hypothetical protein DFQ27_004843 [Actinomortierella ambigua]